MSPSFPLVRRVSGRDPWCRYRMRDLAPRARRAPRRLTAPGLADEKYSRSQRAEGVKHTYCERKKRWDNGAVSPSGVGVLVVEDDETLRRSVDIALRRAGYTVRAEADGTAVEKVVKEFRPDLAILDVRLPKGPDGYAIARSLRREHDLPILFLTAADTRRSRLDGFEAGGDDYVIKPYDTEELLARVAALLRRAGRRKVWRVADLVLDDSTRAVTRNGRNLVLTHTEYELMSTLLQHPRQVLSKVQLLRQVWGFDGWDTNLVEVHMSSLRRKLEAHGPRLIHTVRGSGYTLRP